MYWINFLECRTLSTTLKFTGSGQQLPPVTVAEGIVTILTAPLGRAAATVCQLAANVIVRYLGGDLSFVREVMQQHELQADSRVSSCNVRTRAAI